MNKFLGYDSFLGTILGKAADLLILNFLWVLCCIPVVTIIPATSALYCVTIKMVNKEEPGIVRTFFRSFRGNLKQGIPLSLIFLFCGLVLILDNAYYAALSTGGGKILRIISIIYAVCFFLILTYVPPLQARFENRILQTLKNALLIAIQNLGNTLLVIVIHIVPLAIGVIFPELFAQTLPIWIGFVPAFVAWVCTSGFLRVFKKYE